MFKDERRYDVWERIRQQDLRAFARLLPQSLFRQAAEQSEVALGRSALAIPNLVWLSVLAAVHSTRCFADVLSLTVRTLDLSANGLPAPIRQYPGVKMKTLRRWGPKDRLVRWNKPTGPRWCGLNLPESIALRVIDYHIKGFRSSAIVTSDLMPQSFSSPDKSGTSIACGIDCHESRDNRQLAWRHLRVNATSRSAGLHPTHDRGRS